MYYIIKETGAEIEVYKSNSPTLSHTIDSLGPMLLTTLFSLKKNEVVKCGERSDMGTPEHLYDYVRSQAAKFGAFTENGGLRNGYFMPFAWFGKTTWSIGQISAGSTGPLMAFYLCDILKKLSAGEETDSSASKMEDHMSRLREVNFALLSKDQSRISAVLDDLDKRLDEVDTPASCKQRLGVFREWVTLEFIPGDFI